MQNLKIGLLAASDFVLKHYCLELRKYNTPIIWGVTLLKTYKTLKANGEKSIIFYNEMFLDSAPNIIKRIVTKFWYFIFGDRKKYVAQKLVAKADAKLWVTDSNNRLDQTDKKVPWVQTFHSIHPNEFIGKKIYNYYDLLLLPSEFHKNLLIKENNFDKDDKRLKIIGWPRVDCFFKENVFNREIILREMGLNPNERTIMYAPTCGWYGKHGFFARWFEKEEVVFENLCSHISKLGLNFVVKMHEGITLKNYTNFIRTAEMYNVHWISDKNKYTTDSNPYLWATDVLISDVSGINFEYMTLDKPIVYIDPDVDKEIADYWMLRKFRAGCVAFSSSDLISAIDESLEYPEKFRDERHRVVNKLFYKLDGNAGKRAAEAVINFAEKCI